MLAVEAQSFGGPDVLTVVEAADPTPGPGQVVIDVAAADVMFLDTRLRSGWGTQFFPVAPPYVPGGAVAGVVAAVGPDVDPALIGTRVAAHTAASGIGGGVPTGGYAERALAVADDLLVVPAELDFVTAAALIHDGRTAMAVAQVAAVRAGERVLVTAAGGGLGALLIQLAAAAGATVIAAASPAKLELARELGAAQVVDYTVPGWATEIGAVDVVFDGAGGVVGKEAAAIAGSRFFGYGNAAGGFAAVDPADAAARGLAVTLLPDMLAGDLDWPALGASAIAAAAAGNLKVTVGQIFPMEAAAQAHAAIESRTAVGRTVLTVGAH
ncbi:zinc-binding dehydrogenase [Nocardia stercoris]|uniref:NADPH:quinone reductase n=1 Tax=Nocardia stercoris TaxID=2483361 RepID=A0A3M2L4N8_9NOCA|nr:zinc-binding dehydrogenase [Nocardia stercoris]RMI29488.1 NADPH:quinone reductase [Nocardia stercoris]